MGVLPNSPAERAGLYDGILMMVDSTVNAV